MHNTVNRLPVVRTKIIPFKHTVEPPDDDDTSVHGVHSCFIFRMSTSEQWMRGTRRPQMDAFGTDVQSSYDVTTPVRTAMNVVLALQ
jgi:hypothetical protein